jgi:hypothetical protein
MKIQEECSICSGNSPGFFIENITVQNQTDLQKTDWLACKDNLLQLH